MRLFKMGLINNKIIVKGKEQYILHSNNGRDLQPHIQRLKASEKSTF